MTGQFSHCLLHKDIDVYHCMSFIVQSLTQQAMVTALLGTLVR